MKVERIAPSAPEWSDVLRTAPHDAYHLPGYAQLCARTDGGEPFALLVRDGDSALLQPLLRRPLPNELGPGWDCASPYGYPGPVVRGDDAFARRALQVAGSHLRDEGAVALFVRVHPILDAPLDALAAVGVVQEHGETVVVDLREDDAEHWRQTRSGHRNEINRAKRAGHLVGFDDRPEALREFGAVYRETMQRVGAVDYYNFDDDYFVGLREVLGARLRLVTVEIDHRFAAGALFTVVGGVAQYHLSAARTEFLRHQPTKLVLHFARSALRTTGCEWLHLGGGLGSQRDSLFDFKAGFSRHRRRFRTWRWILDRDRYAQLVRERHGDLGSLDATGFFPDYRRERAPCAD